MTESNQLKTKNRIMKQRSLNRRNSKSQQDLNERQNNPKKHILKWKRLFLKVMNVIEHILFVLLILTCIWLLFNLAGHKVSGISMQPTLNNGDRLIVYRTQQPKRNDIITFSPKKDDNANYVKRVIGLPGDDYYVQGKHLFLFTAEREYAEVADLARSETLPDSTIILFLTEQVADELRSLDKIPEDSYFVVGDNRRNSTDSRSFSLVKKEQIEGVLLGRFYPFDQFGFVH